ECDDTRFQQSLPSRLRDDRGPCVDRTARSGEDGSQPRRPCDAPTGRSEATSGERARMSESPATSYDEVPYESHAYFEAHPDRLAVVATLFGMAPPPVATARVLELGCASGGNLIPMALALPEARFVGVDLSARQVADGQATIDRL